MLCVLAPDGRGTRGSGTVSSRGSPSTSTSRSNGTGSANITQPFGPLRGFEPKRRSCSSCWWKAKLLGWSRLDKAPNRNCRPCGPTRLADGPDRRT